MTALALSLALVPSALAGVGLVRVPSWQVAHFLADGRLQTVLSGLSASAYAVEYHNAAQPIAAAKGTRLCRLSTAAQECTPSPPTNPLDTGGSSF
jgi:DNA-binding transcriptional LysR family regulator